jgi:prephenate dehydrogenase
VSELAHAQVAIVGLGLMGGSLAGALRGKCQAVVGVARRRRSVDLALSCGLIDHGTTDLAAGLHRADVVILATPVRVILRLMEEIGPLLPHGCLLMDLGSTKAEVVARMATLPDHVEPLGGHPMCGKEVSGLAAADATLFQDHTFVLTPLQRTSEEALVQGRALVAAVGARPLILAPDRHDRLVATVSHLPYLLACALMSTTEKTAAVDPTVWEVAASGFRDMSRLAASDVTMMRDILLTNQDAVVQALETTIAQLRELGHMVKESDEERLPAALAALRDRRRSLFT